MIECNDKELGQLLHAYELGVLSAEDSHRFEMHLYECDFCLGRAKEFMDVSKIIANDPDSKTVIKIIAEESADIKGKRKFSPFIKLLVAAALVIVIAVPIFRYGIDKEGPIVIQTLEFIPSRAGGSDIIYLEKGGDAVFNFFIGANFAGSVELVIWKVDGDTLLARPDFSHIDDHGMGTITLPVSDFSEGHYILQAKPIDTSAAPDRLYMFRVK